MSATSQSFRASPADHAAIAALPSRIVAAWAEHDAEAFGAVFVEDGTMILPGLFLTGRDAIVAFMREAFAGPYQGTRVTGQPINVRFLDGEVAIVLTEGGVLAPGETTVAKEHAVRASWLMVKRDGAWLLAAYQNSPSEGA
ncbi:SgcJ/EcaC family oxidoreductase [Micromonospora sp. NPDC002717]|uniref:SgcJ/EcaC family oxidoreductase n=1 Tax=Micromonospora sp. NPDC002717 TaxID=3154424 RepID=UPI003332CDA7